MKEKIAFVIPYFGKFNNYFQLFLNSCACNSNVTWIIFTDNEEKYNYPKNIQVNRIKFDDLKVLFKKKLGFQISLETPYKLCDYRPAYGFIFAEYLKKYDFWGYCDTDLIWGDISDFINDEILSSYDKIGVLGHCTLIRNCEPFVSAFKKDLDGRKIYKEIFLQNEKVTPSFDEEFDNSINNIFLRENYSVYRNLKVAGIYTKSSNFKITTLDSNNEYSLEKKVNGFFVWDQGKLFRLKIKNDNIVSEQYIYIHMQSRKMNNNVSNFTKFKIIPNSFDDMETEIVTKENFKDIKKKHFNFHYFRLRSYNLLQKTKKKFSKLMM